MMIPKQPWKKTEPASQDAQEVGESLSNKVDLWKKKVGGESPFLLVLFPIFHIKLATAVAVFIKCIMYT